MRNLKKGFTLVELIVVITILAILGTIAFISLQGYSAEARNSKRIQDLNSIAKAIQIKVANGSKLISFVGGTGSNGDFSVAGKTVVSTIDYQAGTPNYSAIGIKATDFQDPSSLDDYPVGVTTKKGGQYEIAASMENDSGNRVAKIVGTYGKRTSDSLTVTINTAGDRVTLADADINKIKKYDYIKDESSNKAEVTEVSSDGKTLIVSPDNVSLAGTSIFLVENESDGLINDVTDTDTTTAVTNNSTTQLPY